MAPNPSNVVPGRIVAGDSSTWTRTWSDYPASAGWSLKYTIVGPAGVYSADATAQDDDFVVNLTAAVTATWRAGMYRISEIVAKDSQRITLGTTPLIIAPDPSGAYVASHAQKMLANIEAWLESRAPTAGAIEINGRKLQNYPLPELLAMRDKYARMVAREQADDGIGGARVLVRL